MRYYICNGLGETRDHPTRREMQEFLDGLDPADEEHGAAWVVDEDGNALEYTLGGNLCYDHDDQDPRHLSHVSLAKVLELWDKLAQGRLQELEREPWLPGTREPMPPEEKARRQAELDASRLKEDRSFYDGLGPERPAVPCRAAGCSRSAVSLSALCRPHHFASIRKRPSPFND